MIQEIWRDIPRYEEFYEVSSLGQVRSKPRYVMHSRGKSRCFRKSRILKGVPDRDGYLNVPLSKFGSNVTYRVHRLVAQVFLDNPNDYPIVNHKDLDKQNNCVDNLEWCTQQYNCMHATANGHKSNLSSEMRKKVSQAAARKLSKPMMCVTTGQIFPSLTDASIEMHLAQDTIVRSAKYGLPLKCGLVFKYLL